MSRTAAVALTPREKKKTNTYVFDPASGKKIRSFFMDPTPEEIAEYAERQEEIKSQWSEEEAYKRFQGRKTNVYICPSYRFNRIDMSFSEMASE